jgi:hypothetical protein
MPGMRVTNGIRRLAAAIRHKIFLLAAAAKHHPTLTTALCVLCGSILLLFPLRSLRFNLFHIPLCVSLRPSRLTV